MHLALNYQRVDPSRGGAETYVADLCRLLILGGHRVDLYAESWADDALPREVNVVPVPVSGRTKLERIWSFAENSELAMTAASHECSVGFINTWAHDVIIPQGGVQEGSLRANAGRFPTGLQRRSLSPDEVRQSEILGLPGDREQTIRPAIHGPVRGGQRDGSTASRRVPPRPEQQIHVVPNAIDLNRIDVAQPGAVRCAFRNRMGLEPNDLVGLFVGHNFALKGLKPLLSALGARRQNDRAGGPFTCWSAAAATPVPISAWRNAWESRTRSTSSASTRTSATATGRATSSSSRRTTIRARWSCSRRWRAACP